MDKHHIITVLTMLWLPGLVQGEFRLGNDDRVVFVGDTLVQVHSFTKYVETFVRVRYPQLQTRFINRGMRDLTVSEALRRLQEDVLSASPTVVVVVVGFHDPQQRALDETRLAAFRKDAAELVNRLRAANIRVVLVTPPRPASAVLRHLPDVDYGAVVGAYAQVIRDIGGQAGLTVIDWFESSAAPSVEDTHRSRAAPRSRLYPPRMAHAILAAQLLKHWQARPIELQVEVDWAAAAGTVSSGRISVNRRGAEELAVSLEDLPMPWPLPGISEAALDQADWPGADLCQYVLRLSNAPPSGIELVVGNRGLNLDTAALSQGVNMTGWPPVQGGNPALRTLLSYLHKKHRWQDKYWREVRPRRPQEPELHEAFETYCRALQLFEQGTARVILRLPRTIDVQLRFRAVQDTKTVEGSE